MRIFILSFFFINAIFFIFSLSADTAENVCITCHKENDEKGLKIVKEWEASRHKEVGVTCVDCHGGNPNSTEMAMEKSSGFIGLPKGREIPIFCSRCHADPVKMRQFNLRTDQLALYKTSVHGKRLFEKNDPNVATCISCHGSHDIKAKMDSQSSVYRTRVPETCAKCHEDKDRMKKYNIPSDQYSKYSKSIHGQLLLAKGDLRAPNCADCHGVHGATPPGVKEIPNVCGNCHSLVENYFSKGPHKAAIEKVGAPRCIDCHGNHEIQQPALALFSGNDKGQCGSCHDLSSSPYKVGKEISELLQKIEHDLHQSKNSLEKIKRAGLDVSKELGMLDESKSRIIEAIPITHALSLKEINVPIEKAISNLKAIDSQVVHLREEISFRRKALIWIVLLSLSIIGILYLKKRSL